MSFETRYSPTLFLNRTASPNLPFIKIYLNNISHLISCHLFDKLDCFSAVLLFNELNRENGPGTRPKPVPKAIPARVEGYQSPMRRLEADLSPIVDVHP